LGAERCKSGNAATHLQGLKLTAKQFQELAAMTGAVMEDK
jgi:hypothetical protein